MKLEINVTDETVENINQFVNGVKTSIDPIEAAKDGFDIPNFDTAEAIEILIIAGLEHFREISMRNVMKSRIRQIRDNEVVPAMTIGANGIEIDESVPEPIKDLLSQIGSALQDAMGVGDDDDDECDCPHCQMRRAHEVKGKMS